MTSNRKHSDPAATGHRELVSTSKFLSLVLRHRPESIGVELDAEGWLPVETLIEQARRHGRKLDAPMIQAVVAGNDKQRFALSDDGLRIRANQGHSLTNVDLGLAPVVPPDFLFHGTVAMALPGIRASGLQKQSRQHVHLSVDESTAARVGSRRGRPVILKVLAGEMHKSGLQFFQSANGVWLTDHVPVKYIDFPES